MLTMKTRGVVAGVVAVLALGACTTSSSPSPGSTSGSAGTPVKGGTLNMLGDTDVDYMDPNITYYTAGYIAARLYSRQLYTFPGDTKTNTEPVPDLATAAPQVSPDGLTVTVTMRQGAQWDTTPPRQVTAADMVRGVKRTCNPSQPFGGLPDFQDLIAGFNTFCTGFAKVKPKASAIADYINSHDVSGLKVGATPLTMVFTLTKPASYFPSMLTLTAFSPAPKEWDAYVPASAALGQHIISDGPYKIESYDPTKTLNFVRNPAWTAASDPVRKAYVDKIDIQENLTQESIQQQLQTGNPKADMEFSTFPPPSQDPGLIASKDPLFYLGTTASNNPYVVFNFHSPNNGGAMKTLAFRQALEYGMNRSNMIQVQGGPKQNPPLSQVLPKDIKGGEQAFDLYPQSSAKAKQLLSQTGKTSPTLTLLYNSTSEGVKKTFAVIQQDLKGVGITVKGLGVKYPDIYTKYLQVPSTGDRGVWDMAIAGWGPDWYGDGALSYFKPLFDGKPSFPPIGSNYGFYDSDATNALIAKASVAKTTAESSALWHQADMQVMKDAAFFPITSPLQAVYSAKQVKNVQYVSAYQGYDPANVWLDPTANGG